MLVRLVVIACACTLSSIMTIQALAYAASSGLIYSITEARNFSSARYTAQSAIIANDSSEIELIVVGNQEFIDSVGSLGVCHEDRLDIPVARLSWEDAGLISRHIQALNPRRVLIQMHPELRTNLRSSLPPQRFDALRIQGLPFTIWPAEQAKWAIDNLIDAFVRPWSPSVATAPEVSVTDNAIVEYSPRHRAAARVLRRMVDSNDTKVAWLVVPPDSYTEIGADIQARLEDTEIQPLVGSVSRDLPEWAEDCFELISGSQNDGGQDITIPTEVMEADTGLDDLISIWETELSSDGIYQKVVDATSADRDHYAALLKFILDQDLLFGEPRDLIELEPRPGHVYVRYDVHLRDMYALPMYINTNQGLGVPAVYYLQWRDHPRHDIIRNFSGYLNEWLMDYDHVGLHFGPVSSLINGQAGPNVNISSELLAVMENAPAEVDVMQLTEAVGDQLDFVWTDFRLSFPGARLLSVHGSGWNETLEQLCSGDQECDLASLRERALLENVVNDRTDLIISDLLVRESNIRYASDTGGEERLLCRIATLDPRNAMILLIHPARLIRDRSAYAQSIEKFDVENCD